MTAIRVSIGMATKPPASAMASNAEKGARLLMKLSDNSL
jgi:hypothetical protein